MNFLQKVSTVANKHISDLKAAHDRRMLAAEEKAKVALSRAKSDADRKRVIEKLKLEKLNAERELYEAKTATNRAKAAVLKAKRESGDVGIGERLFKEAKSLGSGSGDIGKQFKSLNLSGSAAKAKRSPVRTGRKKAIKSKKSDDSIHKMLWG